MSMFITDKAIGKSSSPCISKEIIMIHKTTKGFALAQMSYQKGLMYFLKS